MTCTLFAKKWKKIQFLRDLSKNIFQYFYKFPIIVRNPNATRQFSTSWENTSGLYWVCCMFRPALGCCALPMLIKVVISPDWAYTNTHKVMTTTHVEWETVLLLTKIQLNNADLQWKINYSNSNSNSNFFLLENFLKCWNQKMVENGPKKCFDQLSGARSTHKLVEIHNMCALRNYIFCIIKQTDYVRPLCKQIRSCPTKSAFLNHRDQSR